MYMYSTHSMVESKRPLPPRLDGAHLGPSVFQQGVDDGIKLLEGRVAADLHAAGNTDARLGGQLDEAGDPLLTVLSLAEILTVLSLAEILLAGV
jgi:hypothetical protein